MSVTCFADIAVADTEPIADTGVVDIADMKNLHWVMVLDGEDSTLGGSNLLGGRVFVYRYKASSTAADYSYYYSVSRKTEAPYSDWVEWTQAEVSASNLQYSIVSFKGDGVTHKIEIQSKHLGVDKKFTVKGYTVDEDGTYTNEAQAQGRYVARVELEANEGYTFENSGLRATLDERGIAIYIYDDGKKATMTKVWYVANFDNALLDGEATKSAGAQVEYSIPSWKFGDTVIIKYPILFHGDGALMTKDQPNGENGSDALYDVTVDGDSIIETIDGKRVIVYDWDPDCPEQVYDIVKFSLSYYDEKGDKRPVVENAVRSRWNYYINGNMPAAEYEITFNIATVALTSHIHWWDGSEHSYPGESEFTGFNCTYGFTVLPGEFTLVGENDLKNDKQYKYVDIDSLNATTNNYSSFFAFKSALSFDEDTYIDKADLGTDTYWTHGGNLDEYFESAPHLEFNISSMNGNTYYGADNAEWSEYIMKPDTYTVFYMARMKNYSTVPLILDRYKHNYEVVVYKNVPTPSLNRTKMTYTGGQLSVSPNDEDGNTGLYVWDGHIQTAVGKHTVTFTLTDTAHYKWEYDAVNNKTYGFGDAYEAGWEIEPASVTPPQITKRNFSQGKTYVPSITVPTDMSGEPMFSYDDTVTYNEAGEYDIVLTLTSTNYKWTVTKDDNAVWDENEPDKAIVKFIIEPEENMWTVSPRMIDWTWGSYDETLNIFEGTAMRGNDNVRFSICTDKSGLNVVNGLSDIEPKRDGAYGFVDDAVADKMRELNVGSYWLIARLDADRNYTELSGAYKFNVGYATNYWDVAPNIVSWKYGGFDANINLITGKPHFIADGKKVKYSIVSGESENDIGDLDKDFVVHGLLNISIDDNGVVQGEARDILAALDRNRNYWLRAVVDREADGRGVYNYSGLNTYVPLNILQAENYWVETPNVTRWVVGEEANAPTGISKWGEPSFVIYRYVTNSDSEKEKGEKLYDSKEGIDRLSEAKAGWHLLEVSVEGSVNYTAIKSRLEFKVFSTDANFWRTVPNIQSWIAGGAPNAPVAQAAFGEVYFAYYDRADYIANGANAKKLGGVPVAVGKYVLVATAVCDDLDDMVATVEFSIYSASADVNVYYAIIGVLAGIIVLGVELVVMFVILRNRKKLKLVSTEGCGRIELDAADDEDLAEEFDEEFEDEDEQPDIITDDDIDAEVIAEPVDADAPALEPSEIN